MHCPTPNKAKKGFTLVEVLMVLVIISIMAGLLITVINPVRQRARARDGTIIATANKIIAAITAFNSATGVFPTCPELVADLQNATIPIAATCGAGALEGTIRITGLTYRTGAGTTACDAATRYGAAGPAECNFRYERDFTGANACLGIRLHSAENLDDTGALGDYLHWSNTEGRLEDDVTPTCACPVATPGGVCT